MRLAHPKADGELDDVLRWVASKPDAETVWTEVPSAHAASAPLYAMEAARKAETEREIVRLIRDYQLVRECVTT